MAGNRATFTDAIKKGHNAAWDGRWKQAAEHYRRALAEFPEDINARSSMAQALEELGQWESALKEYRSLAEARPKDPMPLMHVASLQEKLHHRSEAARTMIAAAELYLYAKMGAQATEAWHKAAELEPDRTDVRVRLAEYYMRRGQHGLASTEYLALAQIYLRRGDNDRARTLAEQAVSVDRRNTAARDFVEAMRKTTQASGGTNPVGEAQKAALSRLAQAILDEPPPPVPPHEKEERRDLQTRPQGDQAEIDSLIARAVSARTQHQVPEAIEAYRKLLERRIDRAEIKFNLGLLLFESMRYDDAIGLLQQTVGDKDYALASHFTLGQCYRAQGKMDSAVEHFLQVVKIVDLSSVSREQADDLISAYEGLAESYAAKGDSAKAELFSKTLEEFLSSRGWEDKVGQVQEHLETLRQADSPVSVAEVVHEQEPDRVLEALALAQEYMRHEKLGAAMEECYRAIELAPTYLPAHTRLAEILVKQDRQSDAHAKYQALADVCIIRGDLKRAEGMYRSGLNVAPDDVSMRSKLIDLLLKQDLVDKALEQYVELGEVYIRLGQEQKAAEKFGEGARLAARRGNTGPAAVALRHRVAQFRAGQGDFKGALATYQEIRQQSPNDERAKFYAIDLEFRLGQNSTALTDLDELLARYEAKDSAKSVQVLEALAQSYPAESGLIDRLAQRYLASGDMDKAVSVLDALGEGQLAAGQKQEAAVTLRQIIAMNPPRVEEYQRLLRAISE